MRVEYFKVMRKKTTGALIRLKRAVIVRLGFDPLLAC